MSARWLPLVAIGLLAGLSVRLSAQTSTHPFQATDYYKLTSVGEPRVAPDGRRIAFVVTTVVEDKDRRHSEIWMVPTDGSTPAFRYTSPASEAASPTWSPDGSLLAFTSKREGFDDDVWFLRTTPPGGEAFQISGVHAAPLFSDDGKWLLYGWRGPESDRLKQDDGRTPHSRRALRRGARSGPAAALRPHRGGRRGAPAGDALPRELRARLVAGRRHHCVHLIQRSRPGERRLRDARGGRDRSESHEHVGLGPGQPVLV